MKPPEDISIRTVTHNELPRLLDMIHALANHHGDKATLTLDDLRRDVRGTSPWFKILVAARYDELIGYVAITRIGQLGFARRGLDIHHLYVVPAHRRQGVARALLNAATRIASDNNCQYLVIGATEENATARSTYLNAGFSDVASRNRRFRLDISNGN